MLVIFQKGNKIIHEAFASLGTTIKVIFETIYQTRKLRLFFYEP